MNFTSIFIFIFLISFYAISVNMASDVYIRVNVKSIFFHLTNCSIFSSFFLQFYHFSTNNSSNSCVCVLMAKNKIYSSSNFFFLSFLKTLSQRFIQRQMFKFIFSLSFLLLLLLLTSFPLFIIFISLVDEQLKKKRKIKFEMGLSTETLKN